MMRISAILGLSILIGAVALGLETPSEIRQSTSGFYPIWENTGHIERDQALYIGSGAAHIGLADRLHIGVEPIYFIYRTPNAYLKFNLFSSETTSLAIQGGIFHLLEQASRSSFSPMYTSRLDNPDFTLTLVPVALSYSQLIGDWLDLHTTVTELGVFSNGVVRNEGYLGLSLTAEFAPRSRHSLVFHATEIGFWKHDLSVLGSSYRYRNSWFEFRLGYFYRFRLQGNQAAPMIGLAFLL